MLSLSVSALAFAASMGMIAPSYATALGSAVEKHAYLGSIDKRASDSSSVPADFLKDMQRAGLRESQCWVDLSNTSASMSRCFDLPNFIKMAGSSSSEEVNSYLTTWMKGACSSGNAAAKCSRDDIEGFNALLNNACTKSDDQHTPLVRSLSYMSSDYDGLYAQIMPLVCGIIDTNSTDARCVPQVAAQTAPNKPAEFLLGLASGSVATDPDWLGSIASIPCSDCTYYLYKAFRFVFPQMDGAASQKRLGGQLQTCSNGSVTWSDVDDRRKPDDLQVQVVQTDANAGHGRSSATPVPSSSPLLSAAVLLPLAVLLS